MSTPTKLEVSVDGLAVQVHKALDLIDALRAENNRLREALRAANVILLQQNKYSAADHEAMDVIQAALAAGKGTSPDLSADPAAYDRIADRELGPAAGKGETR